MKTALIVILSLFISLNSFALNKSIQTGKIVELIAIEGKSDLELSPKSRYLIINRPQMNTYVVDLEDHNKVIYRAGHGCIEFGFSKDEKYLTIAQTAEECYEGDWKELNPYFLLFDLKKNTVIQKIRGKRPQFSYDSQVLYYEVLTKGGSRGFTKAVKLDGMIQQKDLCTYTFLGHHLPNFLYTKISRNNQFVACPVFDSKYTYQVQSTASGQVMSKIQRHPWEDKFLQYFSNDNSFFVMNDEDGTPFDPILFDLDAGGIQVETPMANELNVLFADVSKDGEQMVITDVTHKPVGNDQIEIISLNYVNRKTQEHIRIEDISRFTGDPLTDPPVIDANKKVLYATVKEGAFVAIDFKGQELWRINIPPAPAGLLQGSLPSSDGRLVFTTTAHGLEIIGTTIFKIIPPDGF